MRVLCALLGVALALSGSADAKAATLSYKDYAQEASRNRLSNDGGYTNEAAKDKVRMCCRV